MKKKWGEGVIKHYCDICGKLMQDKTVMSDKDPLDYCYGEFEIEMGISLEGHYQIGFDEICHECVRRIENITIDDFHTMFIKNLMGIKRSDNNAENAE